jgi:dolichyl-phosphate beta-glucosyltransferase
VGRLLHRGHLKGDKTTRIRAGITIKLSAQIAEALSVDQTVFQSTFTSSGQRSRVASHESGESAVAAASHDDSVRSALLSSVLSRSPIESATGGATISVLTANAHPQADLRVDRDESPVRLASRKGHSGGTRSEAEMVPASNVENAEEVHASTVELGSPTDDSVHNAAAPIDLASRRLPSPEFDSIAAELAKRSITLDLCLVVPMYNEAKRIAASIKTLAASALSSDRVGFVFVDDGSTDNTVSAARAAIAEFGLAQAQVLVLKANLGKGGAVRAGMLTATASAHYVGYLDADLSLDPSDVAAAFTRMRASDAEVLVGDRIVDATHQPKLRRLASLTFRSLAAMVAPTGVRDTQCAMKLFRANVARNVFEPLQTNGFGFDVEVLVRARAIGARVDELPIAWTHTEGSSVNAAAESYRMMRDVLKVRRALLNG